MTGYIVSTVKTQKEMKLTVCYVLLLSHSRALTHKTVLPTVGMILLISINPAGTLSHRCAQRCVSS